MFAPGRNKFEPVEVNTMIVVRGNVWVGGWSVCRCSNYGGLNVNIESVRSGLTP